MGTITFGGLASGLDTNTIISELVSAQSAPLNQMKTKQQHADSASSTLTSFAQSLTSLRSAASVLADPAQFSSFTATASDSSVVGSVYGAAQPGTYSLQVDALAQEQRTYADPQSSSTDPLGQSGSFDLTIGGAKTTISVASTDSLSDVASSINSSGARVTASIVFDGASYRLQVRGLDSGASNAITFAESGTSLGLSNPANTVQRAQDAQLTLDGYTVTRPTNSVVGVIPGVSLALTKTTSSPVTLQVQSDPAGLETKIKSFVSAYNAVVAAGHAAAGYGSSAAQNPALQSDSGIRNALDRLSSLIASPVAGATGAYTSLGDVGITTDNGGTLSLDTTKLETALTTDPTSVSKLFVVDASHGSTGVMGSFKSAVDLLTGTVGASIDAEITSFQTMSKSLQDDELGMQRQIDAYQQRLQTQFTALEQQVSKYKALESQISNAVLPGFGSSTTSSK